MSLTLLSLLLNISDVVVVVATAGVDVAAVTHVVYFVAAADVAAAVDVAVATGDVATAIDAAAIVYGNVVGIAAVVVDVLAATA